MSITWPSLRVNALILLHVVVHSNQECIDGFQYLCGSQQIPIIRGNTIYLAAPGSPPTCNLNVAADCSAEIQAKAGLKIQLTFVNALPTCGGDNYVEFADGVSAPLRLCSGNITSRTFADSGLNVTFRSSTSSNVMSIALSAIGCPVDELITGPHISADVDQTANRVRYNATVKCSSGYLMNTKSTELSVACALNFAVQTYSWEYPGDKYTCQAAQCLAPPTVHNAAHNRTLSRYSYLSTVSYRCNPGYLMLGNRSIQCVTENNRGAIWTNGSTQCQPAVCLTPPSIINGSFSPQRNSYQYASNATYSCNQGYLLVGSAEITCTVDSDIQTMWSSLSASCQSAQCWAPLNVLYASNDGTLATYPYLSTVNYACNPGYLISGNRTMQCSTQNNVAKWSNTAVQCQAAVCQDPPSLGNGSYMRQNSYTYLSEVVFSCNAGFVLEGSRTVRCITNADVEARWTVLSASCRYVNCGLPSAEGASFTVPNSTGYGAEFRYLCRKSLLPAGEQIAKCEADSTWSMIKCTEARCPKLSASRPFTNVRSVPEQPVAGSTVTFQCTLDSSTITFACISNGWTGVWNVSFPTCPNQPLENDLDQPEEKLTNLDTEAAVGVSVGVTAALFLMVICTVVFVLRRRIIELERRGQISNHGVTKLSQDPSCEYLELTVNRPTAPVENPDNAYESLNETTAGHVYAALKIPR